MLAALTIVLLVPCAAHAADRAATPEMIEGAPSYVRFPPIFIPVVEGDRITEQVGVTLMLQLVKGQEKAPVEDKRLQLNNAFVQDLYGFFQQRAPLHRPINEDYLKGRLLNIASAVVGKDVVQEVLIQQLFEEKR